MHAYVKSFFLKKNLECSPPISHSVCPLRLLFVLSTNIG